MLTVLLNTRNIFQHCSVFRLIKIVKKKNNAATDDSRRALVKIKLSGNVELYKYIPEKSKNLTRNYKLQ